MMSASGECCGRGRQAVADGVKASKIERLVSRRYLEDRDLVTRRLRGRGEVQRPERGELLASFAKPRKLVDLRIDKRKTHRPSVDLGPVAF
jgi:hypothetical protein